MLERERISLLADRGLSIRDVARRLDRSPSTIPRGLRRNRADHDRAFDAVMTHVLARHRGRRQRSGRLLADQEFRQVKQGKLELEWSPEQIAAWLRREFPDQGLARVPRDELHGSVLGRRWWSEQDLDGPAAHRPPAVERRRRTEHRRARFNVPIVLIDRRSSKTEPASTTTGRVT